MKTPTTVPADTLRSSDDEALQLGLARLLKLVKATKDARAIKLALDFENGTMTEIDCAAIDQAVADLDEGHRPAIEAAVQNVRHALQDIEEELLTAQIRDLNDRFRTTQDPSLGVTVMSREVQDLQPHEQQALLRLAMQFDDFNAGLDPEGFHQAGKVEFKGVEYWFWIDVLDVNYQWGSESPEDPKESRRVMTIMRPHER